MQTIGVLGGMSPDSTLTYYDSLVNFSRERGWDKKTPEIIIYNLDFGEFYDYLRNDRHEMVIELLCDKINDLEEAGADFGLMASNTPHYFLDEIKERIDLPLIDIAETTLREAKKRGYEKIGLLGTKFTLKGGVYEKRIDGNDIELVLPTEEDINYVDQKIFGEFVKECPPQETLQGFKGIVEEMKEEEDIDAVVLGCTELPLYLTENYLNTPVLDTTKLHAKKAFEKSIEQDGFK